MEGDPLAFKPCGVGYKNVNFDHGDEFIDMVTSTRALWSMNNQISSLNIHPGYTLIGYEDYDYTGRSKEFASLNADLGADWDDQLSSWRCVETGGKLQMNTCRLSLLTAMFGTSFSPVLRFGEMYQSDLC